MPTFTISRYLQCLGVVLRLWDEPLFRKQCNVLPSNTIRKQSPVVRWSHGPTFDKHYGWTAVQMKVLSNFTAVEQLLYLANAKFTCLMMKHLTAHQQRPYSSPFKGPAKYRTYTWYLITILVQWTGHLQAHFCTLVTYFEVSRLSWCMFTYQNIHHNSRCKYLFGKIVHFRDLSTQRNTVTYKLCCLRFHAVILACMIWDFVSP